MNENEFGICSKITLDFPLNGTRYIDERFTEKATLHDVKSIAGKSFHKDFIQSVCVYDYKGTARLYLKKTANGVIREER